MYGVRRRARAATQAVDRFRRDVSSRPQKMTALFIVAGVAVIGAFALRPVFTLLGWRRSA